MKLTTLFSGSKGNCTLVQSSEANILVDAGFSYSKILDSLKQVELTPTDIHGIFVTHEHIDHISALKEWTALNSTPIFVHENIAEYMEFQQCCNHVTAFCDAVVLRDLKIDFTPCSHDSACCCGFRFFDGKNYVAILTDTGVITEQNLQFLSPCQTVMLESNHDLYMLKTGDYPYPLKRRIMSTKGHLSNQQASEVLEKLINIGKLKNMVFGHLSQNNNTSELAFFQAMQILTKHKLIEGRDLKLTIAEQYKISAQQNN